jgi:hypothetical protein
LIFKIKGTLANVSEIDLDLVHFVEKFNRRLKLLAWASSLLSNPTRLCWCVRIVALGVLAFLIGFIGEQPSVQFAS